LDVPDYGLQLMSGYEASLNGTKGDLLATRIFGLTDVVTNAQYFNSSILFNHVQSKIVDFVITSTPDGFNGVRANRTPVIEECEIHWVVQRIASEMRSGKLIERTINSVPFAENSTSHWDSLDENWYTLRPTLTLPDPHSPSPDGMSEYWVDNTTARKVWQTLAQVVPSVYLQPGGTSEISGLNVMKLAYLNAEASSPHVATDIGPLLPWDTPNNVSAYLSEITRTMNHVIRNNAASVRGQGDVVHGHVFRNTVLVRVNWAWFAFPATLWCLAVVFLAATIWRSSKLEGKAASYKSSLLPMLLERDGRDIGDRSMSSMRSQAKTSHIRLDRRAHGS